MWNVECCVFDWQQRLYTHDGFGNAISVIPLFLKKACRLNDEHTHTSDVYMSLLYDT